MSFEYFYKSQSDKYSFIRIPKAMMTEDVFLPLSIQSVFLPLSIQSKLLYGLLLDRMSVSVKNKWIDKEGKVYVIYKIEDICSDMGTSKSNAVKYVNELCDMGLVEKVQRGMGMPNLLYVKNFALA